MHGSQLVSRGERQTREQVGGAGGVLLEMKTQMLSFFFLTGLPFLPTGVGKGAMEAPQHEPSVWTVSRPVDQAEGAEPCGPSCSRPHWGLEGAFRKERVNWPGATSVRL